MWTLTRRAALLGAGAYLGYQAAQRWAQTLPSQVGTRPLAQATGDVVLNDASELSATPVHRHALLSDGPEETVIARLRAEMAEARDAGRPVNVGAARHSMGGQAIPREGHAMTFEVAPVAVDSAAGTYLCPAGARWADVIAALDSLGLSPAVMQSNHDFGVAATFCVNAHGWPVPFGPMGTSVRALRLLLPSGDVVTCSRAQNVDLFNLTMGGYGLTGVVLDLELQAVSNQRLQPRFEDMSAEDFAAAFAAVLSEPGLAMAYGRLNVDRAAFLSEALLVTYHPMEDQENLPAAQGSGRLSHIASEVYRAQLGRERMKRVRWWVETGLAPRLSGGAVTRNSLLNEPVSTLANDDPRRTDILHEYFVPFDRYPEFLQACRDVIPASYQNLLNVTLRFVNTDPESLLAYAPGPRIAAVMSFSQEKTARAEADMRRMTQALIARVIALGGSYYLPYRPHATQGQFLRAYPRAEAFALQKRAIDPDTLFRNNLWDTYLAGL